jgi:hypothetical protein
MSIEQKFRKKPITVEAFQWKGVGMIRDVGESFPPWFKEARKKERLQPHWGLDKKGRMQLTEHLEIVTPEGVMVCRFGDWIIQGVQGELYPCRADIFEKTYERVEEEVHRFEKGIEVSGPLEAFQSSGIVIEPPEEIE